MNKLVLYTFVTITGLLVACTGGSSDSDSGGDTPAPTPTKHAIFSVAYPTLTDSSFTKIHTFTVKVTNLDESNMQYFKLSPNFDAKLTDPDNTIHSLKYFLLGNTTLTTPVGVEAGATKELNYKFVTAKPGKYKLVVSGAIDPTDDAGQPNSEFSITDVSGTADFMVNDTSFMTPNHTYDLSSMPKVKPVYLEGKVYIPMFDAATKTLSVTSIDSTGTTHNYSLVTTNDLHILSIETQGGSIFIDTTQVDLTSSSYNCYCL